jgi:hypothetical protein
MKSKRISSGTPIEWLCDQDEIDAREESAEIVEIDEYDLELDSLWEAEDAPSRFWLTNYADEEQ